MLNWSNTEKEANAERYISHVRNNIFKVSSKMLLGLLL